MPSREAQRREAYERQGGICPRCGKHFEIGGMEADHIDPVVAGREDERSQLPDAVPRGQPTQGRNLGQRASPGD